MRTIYFYNIEAIIINMDSSFPRLTEPGVKYFISSTLKECRKFKDRHISILFNIGMIMVFIIIVGGFLFYKYKGKLTAEEIQYNNRIKHEYIISKLQQLTIHKHKQNETLITNLPTWENHPEASILQNRIYT
jgi:hypothetical protein